MLPLRLVLDTNVVVSALLNREGLENVALLFALTSPARLYVTQTILQEYERVLHQPRLKLPDRHVASAIDLIRRRAAVVDARQRLFVTSDPDDNAFLECADAARADYLITGNKRHRHFPPYWKSCKIINARELLELIAPHLPKRT